jgi:glomulin
MYAAICNCTPVAKNVQQTNNEAHPYISFWAPNVFELVELVLKPPQGGSPSLPEQRDAVFFLLHEFFVIYKILISSISSNAFL